MLKTIMQVSEALPDSILNGDLIVSGTRALAEEPFGHGRPWEWMLHSRPSKLCFLCADSRYSLSRIPFSFPMKSLRQLRTNRQGARRSSSWRRNALFQLSETPMFQRPSDNSEHPYGLVSDATMAVTCNDGDVVPHSVEEARKYYG